MKIVHVGEVAFNAAYFVSAVVHDAQKGQVRIDLRHPDTGEAGGSLYAKCSVEEVYKHVKVQFT